MATLARRSHRWRGPLEQRCSPLGRVSTGSWANARVPFESFRLHQGGPMRKLVLALLVSMLVAPAMTAAAADPTTAIRQFLDAFNSGDMKSANAAYATGDLMIVDEFPPFRWYGPNAPQGWADSFDKLAKAEGVSDAKVQYGPPSRTEIE